MQLTDRNSSHKYWLCHYFENYSTDDIPEHLQNIWSCNWLDVLNHPIVNQILQISDESKTIWSSHDSSHLLVIAIAALQAFVQENFVGPKLDAFLYSELPFYANLQNDPKLLNEISLLLNVDGEEINVNVSRPELLVITRLLLEHLIAADREVSTCWYLRYLYVHQQVIDEHTDTLYAAFLKYSEVLVEWATDTDTQALLRLEVAQGLLAYRRTWKAKAHLEKAREMLGATIDVTAFLGKRTKWQQKALPQMALHISLAADLDLCPAEQTHEHTILPTLLKLDDDVRLERITFESEEDNRTLGLSGLVQQLVLATLQYILKSQPKDNLADEELAPYLTTLLYQTNGAWSSRISTLLLNIAQESNHKRTVERSLKQCEEVANLVTVADEASVFQRLSLAYCSYIRPRWLVQAQLGALMTSLGMIKTALDLYLQLRKWDEVIACYTLLELRHKAAEIIQQELDKRPTVELWCLLGDATDDAECYARAWDLSGHRSGRAQRHWGCFHFARRDFEAAIVHLQRSLELNSLQESVWLRLGYAALMLENWPLAADAYRRYTTIEPNGFESWNNLSKAYINMGDKRRAHKVLQEALKCNFGNWKVWENFLLVSVDTGNFEDAINAFNQLIALRGKYFDAQVLQIVAKAVAGDVPDAEGNSTVRLTKKAQQLVGHLGVLYPQEATVWLMAAELRADDPLIRSQHLQKAYRCLTQSAQQTTSWSKDPVSCAQVLRVCGQLCASSLAAWTDRTDASQAAARSQLSSARLSVQGCVRAASDAKWDECAELIDELDTQAMAIKAVLLQG